MSGGRLSFRYQAQQALDLAILMTWQSLTANAVALLIMVGSVGYSQAESPRPVMLDIPSCARVPAGRDWAFLIFFDQHSDQINKNNQNPLVKFAGIFISHHISALELDGYTDASETEDRDLGTRRAKPVEAAFAKAGIPPNIVVIHDLGASRPLAPTAVGVPEALNRRIELRPVLHSTDEELKERRDCEDWLRNHADECERRITAAESAEACRSAKSALSTWYFPD